VSVAKIEQAGAVVFKAHRASPRVLLVTSRRNPETWIFPKGHIESGEKARETALRETREEAGATGEVVGRVGSVEFDWGKDVINVEYFLVRWRSDIRSDEGRQRRWCTVEEATELLEFDGARGLLEKAARKWKETS
jgi:8-oxo-dGTP pyrophosphatase MutT (NUDIX family)